MAEPRQELKVQRRRRPTRRWTLEEGAPEWLRRIWEEGTREVPKGPDKEPDRIRRIAYL